MTESKITRDRIEKFLHEARNSTDDCLVKFYPDELEALCILALQAEASHSIISALQAEIKSWKEAVARLRLELDAEQIAHSQCRTEKNNLVLKAYPAMDERDALRARVEKLQGQTPLTSLPEPRR